MKLDNTLADLSYELLTAEIDNFLNKEHYDDAIRMRFLEESAQYFGVYIDNNPIRFLDNNKLN